MKRNLKRELNVPEITKGEGLKLGILLETLSPLL